MTKSSYIKHPLKPTAVGRAVLQARLSLRETQPEFAKRFKVSHMTIHKWETGKVEHLHRIYRHLLDALVAHLKANGQWMADDILTTVYRTELENKGNALR